MVEPTAHGNPAVEHAHAPTNSKLYIRIAIILAVITFTEVAVSFLPNAGIIGIIEVVALLMLSVTKGALVVMYFMHLKFDSRWFTMLFVSGTVIATFLVLACLALFRYKANVLG
jgi:caa(3)-type oxidase subunit IV